MISRLLHGNATQTTSPTCPTKPISYTKGPPGRPGSKGEPGYGKFTKAETNTCLYSLLTSRLYYAIAHLPFEKQRSNKYKLVETIKQKRNFSFSVLQ